MNAEMIERLRERAAHYDGHPEAQLDIEAAAALDAQAEEIAQLRSANSSFASESICHGDRQNDLLTCPKSPCDNCLQWQRRRADRAEADGKTTFDLWCATLDRAVKAEAEREALRQDAERLIGERDRQYDETCEQIRKTAALENRVIALRELRKDGYYHCPNCNHPQRFTTIDAAIDAARKDV